VITAVNSLKSKKELFFKLRKPPQVRKVVRIVLYSLLAAAGGASLGFSFVNFDFRGNLQGILFLVIGLNAIAFSVYQLRKKEDKHA